MNFAICSEIFQGWETQRIFDYAAHLGYEAVEIAPFTLSDSVTNVTGAQRKRLRDAAHNAGISISGIHWVLVKPEGLYINHLDPAIRQRTSAYFCELVDFCADLGGHYLVVGSPKQRNILPAVAPQQAWEWATETFRSPVAKAAERNVTICLEPLSPAETNFINTAPEAIRFIRQFDDPHFRIILDVKAMSSEGRPIPSIIREAWPYFAYFHANDPNMKGPGFGPMDFKPIAAALREVGYQGYVSVEVFKFDEGAEAIASKSLAYLKACFQR